MTEKTTQTVTTTVVETETAEEKKAAEQKQLQGELRSIAGRVFKAVQKITDRANWDKAPEFSQAVSEAVAKIARSQDPDQELKQAFALASNFSATGASMKKHTETRWGSMNYGLQVYYVADLDAVSSAKRDILGEISDMRVLSAGLKPKAPSVG